MRPYVKSLALALLYSTFCSIQASAQPAAAAPNKTETDLGVPNESEAMPEDSNESEPDLKVPNETEPDLKVPNETEPDLKVPNESEPDLKVPNETEPDLKVPNEMEPVPNDPTNEAMPEEPADAAPLEGAPPAATAQPRDPNVVLPTGPTEVQRILGKPETVDQLYRVIDRDISYGKIEDAKGHLNDLLKHPEFTPEKAVELREKYGAGLPLRLQINPDLREGGELLAKRFQEANQKVTLAPERIRRLIGNLSKTEGERTFAIRQLRLAGPYAIPYFVDAILSNDNQRADVEAAMYYLNPSVWPAVAALLDADDPRLVTLAIDLLREYDQKRAAEFLWYLSASPKRSRALRDDAANALAVLTRTPARLLPSASKELTSIADAYYRHDAAIGIPPETVTIWRWVDGRLVSSEESVSAAEEYYGLRAARQAVELSPENRQAAVLLVSLALEKNVERVGIDNVFAAMNEGQLDSLTAAGPDILADVLAKALKDGRTAVAIVATMALGTTGSASLLLDQENRPGVLARALNSPDRRVQFAAAVSALEIRPSQPFPGARRVVEILAQMLDPQTKPRVVIVSPSSAIANDTSHLLEQLDFVPLSASNGRDAFRLAAEAAGIDRIIMNPGFQNWDMERTLVNLRADARTSGIPIYIVASKDERFEMEDIAARYSRVYVIPPVDDKDKLATAFALVSDDWQSKPFSPAETAMTQRVALDWIERLARGELSYMDVRPAVEALGALIENPEVGAEAVEILGYIPSADIQRRLATMLLSGTIPPGNRVAALDALTRNVQFGGVAIDSKTITQLLQWDPDPENPAAVQALSRLAGALRPHAGEAVRRIIDYKPKPLAKAAPVAPADEAPMEQPKEVPAPSEPAAAEPTDSAMPEETQDPPAAEPTDEKMPAQPPPMR